MKSNALVIFLLFLLVSCARVAGPPVLKPLASPPLDTSCSGPFPKGTWQLTHAIEGTLPGGRKTSAIGVTEISSRNRSARCILMTVEGFVLFDGTLERGMHVRRAVHPFDSDAFAKGLSKDIRSIFFPPEGTLTQRGAGPKGLPVCRYREADSTVIDLVSHANGAWTLREYHPDEPNRTVYFHPSKKGSANGALIPLPKQIRLEVEDDYMLRFTLIRARVVAKTPGPRKQVSGSSAPGLSKPKP